MKKLTAILLALCLLSGMAALAEEGVAPPMGDAVWYCDDLSYSAYVEGALQGDVVIPDRIDGNTVYVLNFNALCDQNEVTSLTTPETLYVLQENSIAYMTDLQSVTLNDALEVIADSNFNNCPSLTSVTIPAGVRMIGESFKSCASLREIYFEGVCPIFLGLDWAFYDLPEDYVIYVPDDQMEAYADALAEAYYNVAAHLQPSGKNAVVCEASNNDEWFSFDASTGTITGYSQYYPFVEVPASIGGVAVKSIAGEAMRGDQSIFGLVLPEGLERVERAAFENASNLTYLSLPSSLKVIEDDAFNYIAGTQIDWSEGLETIGARAFQGTRLTTLTLPSTVKTIGESAFERVPLGELYLSGDLERIDSRAFADCFLSYMAFDFYEPIEIEADAFANSNVADLDLPWDSSFENRAQYAELLRDQCPNCTVWINNPVVGGVAENPVYDESICRFENGVWTMYEGDQTDLTPWTWYDDIQVTGLGDGVFKGNQTLRSFYPHHCGWFTAIGNEAFADSSVEYVELFGSITTIGSGAFRNCLNLTELTLPASLTEIGADALAGCDNLQKLTVLCDPAILPDGLLDECFAHTEIYAAPDATDEQVKLLSQKAHRPWYAPVSRAGEPSNDLIEMPYAMFSIDDFWYDTEYARLDRYHGYELNLYLPREAEGMTLNTIGGDMMGRARGGDNYEMELPVKSVVIPENYTNIYSTTFAGCETLETVICYAPLEETAAMFEGCTNLREVIFVNGVRELGRGIFYGCDKLETVYVGPYVEEISDEALIGCPNFDLSKCITDPALMPDVDALLATVKSEAMPLPTPDPTAAPAVPVSEDGAAYIGTWTAETLEMDGEAYPVAEMGMEMYFSLNADGTAESYDGETTESGTWTIENGAIMIGGAIEGMVPMTVSADGALIMEEDGVKLIFVKTDGASAPATEDVSDTAPAVPTAEEEGFIGTWYGCYLATGAMNGDPREMFEILLTVNEDGTANLAYPTDEPYHWVENEDGSLLMTKDLDGVEMPLSMLGDGYICLGSMDGDGNAFGGYIVFNRDAAALWTPDMLSMTAAELSSEASADVSGAPNGSMEVRYVCQSADANGVTLDASLLGGEYALTFHANGTVDFVMVGNTIPGLKWTQGDGSFIIDYYGNTLEAVPTENGLDLDYFSSMLMHFVPES